MLGDAQEIRKRPRGKKLTDQERRRILVYKIAQWSNIEVAKRLERNEKMVKVFVKHPAAYLLQNGSIDRLYYFKRQKALDPRCLCKKKIVSQRLETTYSFLF